MAEVVASHAQTSFATPVNATTADASVVLSNDNTLRATYNAHDADPGIHVQSSALAQRPAAGSAGRKWLTTDGLRVYYDTGSVWSEIAYLSLAGGGTVAANTTFSAVVLLANGTAGAPSVAFTNSATTGFFRAAADAIGVALGGNEDFRFSSGQFAPRTTGTAIVTAPAALATNTISGFLQIPSCAGTPTGTPGQVNACIPVVVDSTNKIPYWFDGSAWVSYRQSHGTTAAAALGYITGAGGTVTQATNRVTGVTLSKLTGQITTHNASLAAEASAAFVVTNTLVAATDTVILSQASGSDGGNTAVTVVAVGSGSFTIRVSNNNAAGGTAETGAIVINYSVIKGASA